MHLHTFYTACSSSLTTTEQARARRAEHTMKPILKRPYVPCTTSYNLNHMLPKTYHDRFICYDERTVFDANKGVTLKRSRYGDVKIGAKWYSTEVLYRAQQTGVVVLKRQRHTYNWWNKSRKQKML